jgi:PAS domain S-box-containing protein
MTKAQLIDEIQLLEERADAETGAGSPLRDVTQERLNRRRLADLAKFPEEAPHPILRTARDGRLLYANGAARAVAGLLIGRGGNRLTRRLARALDGTGPAAMSLDIDFDNGARAFSFVMAPIKGEDYINWYGRDVTDERRANQRNLDLAKFPAENPNPVFRVTPDGAVLEANHVARAVGGLLVGRGRTRLCRRIAKLLPDAVRRRKPRNETYASGERLIALDITPIRGESYLNIYGRDVTEEHNARKALEAANDTSAAAEERLQTIIDNSPATICLKDSKGRYQLVNKRFAELHGTTANAVIGKTAHELISKEIADPFVVHDRRLLRSGIAEEREQVVATTEGPRTFNEIKFPIATTGKKGGASAIGLIATDITERKKAEEALRESEAHLRLALDTMPSGIRLVDKERNYVLFNARYSELYDFPEGLLKVGESHGVENLFQAERGNFGPGDPKALTDTWLKELPVTVEPQTWVRGIASGKILHASTAPTPEGGFVNIVTDVT